MTTSVEVAASRALSHTIGLAKAIDKKEGYR